MWRMGRGISGVQELVVCPAEPGARRTLIMLGPACGCEAAVATKLLRSQEDAQGQGFRTS